MGVDASGEMLAIAAEEARARLGREERRRLTTVIGDAEALPFEDESFDLVVSSFVIQLVGNRAQALREALRVLRPGGRIAYTTWLAANVSFPPDRVFDAVLAELGLDERDQGDGGSPDLASPRAAADGLRRAGFRRARASAGMLAHPFDAEGYVGFITEFDEEDFFDRLTRRQRQRLTERLRERLAALPRDDLVLRLPIVRATGVVPADRAEP
jgi:SAM-dependent methyltransferase